jgi:uncharacterized YccA/Bax inhibitor family protein
MSMFKGGSPALNDKTFENVLSRELEGLDYERMTVQGAAGKFGTMMIMMLLAAAFAWLRVANSDDNMIWMFGSMIGGFIVAMIIIFKPIWAPKLALGYALLEGIFLGTISAIVNTAFEKRYPGIAGQAVLLTLGVAVAIFALYYFRILKATPIFTKVIIFATAGIAIFYLLNMVLRMFGGSGVPFLHDSSPMGIGISLFIVAIAALNLVLDFDRIEKGAQNGAPKYMEWYGAFGLTLTIVWLYLEVLKLLMKLGSRR